MHAAGIREGAKKRMQSVENNSLPAWRRSRFKVKAMNKRLLWLVTLVLLGSTLAEAQQPGKIPRIGYLATGATSARTEAFRQGLRELGYVERKNIVVEYRYAEGGSDRERELAAELVR